MKFGRTETPLSTYSIVARDPDTGDLGVAVQTHQMCVGWMVPWLLPGVGAVATQSLVNISFGPLGIAMLKEGLAAPDVVSGLIASDARAHSRQLAVVDAQGRVGAWTGTGCIPEAGHLTGEGYSVQANLMEKATVVEAMAGAYEGAAGYFAERLLAALEAAEGEGGDIRGMQSAAMKIVVGDPQKAAEIHEWESKYDLRVDESGSPLAELRRLVRLRTSQLISEDGERAFEEGRSADGLELWRQAREMAPELEETGFWQAMLLADNYADLPGAVEILKETFQNDPRRDLWFELIPRLQTCGLLERAGVAESILSQLGG